MMPDAAVTSFAIVFGLFVVVTAVLLVLVVRFTLQRARVARARWLADSADDPEPRAEEGDDDRELTALVLAGGGTRGAVQIGMLQVLTEHGFVPDRIYGSSVGAVNGVAFAGDPTRAGVERMTEIWRGLTRDDVYPQGRLHGPWLYFQQRDSVYPNTGLRKVVEAGIDFDRLEDAVIPVEVVATSLTDGQERWFTYGSAMDAVLASTAVPAIFPPVEIDGERFIDGGVVNNVPVRRAIESGATRIVVLLCGSPVYVPASPRRPVEAMLNALLISIHSRFAREMAQLPPGVEVIVCTGSAEGYPGLRRFLHHRVAHRARPRRGLGGGAPLRARRSGYLHRGHRTGPTRWAPELDGRHGQSTSDPRFPTAGPVDRGGVDRSSVGTEAAIGVEPLPSVHPEPGT